MDISLLKLIHAMNNYIIIYVNHKKVIKLPNFYVINHKIIFKTLE